MSQELRRRTPEPPNQRAEPPWRAVAGNTVRLWLERHHLIAERPAGRRHRLIVALSAVAAMAIGAGLTLAFTGGNQAAGAAARSGAAVPGSSTALQQAAANRHQAAVWVATQVSRSEVVACDPQMCPLVESSGFPASSLMPLLPTAPDPLGSELVIATPAIQSQFGTRLADVYAPQVIAKFGSGAEQIDIRYMAPYATPAAELAPYLQARITAGMQLLSNKNIQPSATARAQLLAGQVDPRLLVTLSLLKGKFTLKLVAFDDSSPGEGSAIPLRGAEIGAKSSADLSTILTILRAQQGVYAPAGESITTIAGGLSVVTVRYDAPGPMEVAGS
jgi:hypothetical protein